MEKKQLLTLLLVLIAFFQAQFWALATTSPLSTDNFLTNTCNTPAPEDLRVTSIGANTISLAWNPNFPGANHIISLFEDIGNNNWVLILSEYLPNSSGYTIDDYDQTKRHKIEVRTVCENGIISTEVASILPPYGLILELTLAGRNPGSTSVVQCEGIPYPVNKSQWIGFRLKKMVNGSVVNSSLFEYEKANNSPDPQVMGKVKRVQNTNNLVAANDEPRWPIISNSTVRTSSLKFLVGELDQFGTDIYVFGEVDVTLSNSSVDICFLNTDQTGAYIFEPLKGLAASGLWNETDTRGDQESESFILPEFFINTPFSDHIQIKSHAQFGGFVEVEVYNINGTLVAENRDFFNYGLNISTEVLSRGTYIVKIKSSSQIVNLVTIKV